MKLSQESLKSWVTNYLGRKDPLPGDVDLSSAFNKIPLEKLEQLASFFTTIKNRSGRLFVYGNGGSFDNAKLIASQISTIGIESRVPANETFYRKISDEISYHKIFIEALKKEGFDANDAVMGISGSGNSENILFAHDYALRVRMKRVEELLEQLNTSYAKPDLGFLNLPLLAEDQSVLEDVAKGLTAFDKWLNDVYLKSQKEKDNESLDLINQLQSTQNIVSLGGRDGGKMRRLTGDSHCLIAPTFCMEALEDLHPIAIEAISSHLRSGVPIQEAYAECQHHITLQLKSESLIDEVVRFAAKVEQLVFSPGSRMIIVGNSLEHPSIPHMEADFGRGLINMLPISGPEITFIDHNIDAWMATANDDGDQCRYIDQLAKIRLSQEDFVVFIGGHSDESFLSPCLDYVEQLAIPYFIVGHSISQTKAHIPVPNEEYLDLVVTNMIHTTSFSVNSHIRDANGIGWKVYEADTSQWNKELVNHIFSRMNGQKKPVLKDNQVLNEKLRESGNLSDKEEIIWCYGKPYVALTAHHFGLKPGYY